MAVVFSLTICRAVNGDCGKLRVPGGGVVHEYYGCLEDPFELHLGDKVRFIITGLRILEHPHPLVLLGVNALRHGCVPPGLNYIGRDFHEDGGGCLKFKSSETIEHCPLHCVPAGAMLVAPANQLSLIEPIPMDEFTGQYL